MTEESGWLETYRGVVFPWHCDQFGHMNVRWYGHLFDDASFQIWPMIGYSLKQMSDDGFHTFVARTEIDYVQEIRAGELYKVRSGFIRCGGKSATHLQEMTNADTGVLHAVQRTVEVFVDASARASIPIPDTVRPLIEKHLVEDRDHRG